MLLKPDLTKADITKIKSVTVELLKSILSRMEDVQDIFGKDSTRAAFRQHIYDHLFDEASGLPAELYSVDDVETATESIFSFYAIRPALFEGSAFAPHCRLCIS